MILAPSSRLAAAGLPRLAAAATATAASGSSVLTASSRRNFTTAKADSVQIAAVDDGSATTSITVALKAGPRYESAPGVSHALKNFLFKSNKKRSALHLIREAELYGGVLSAATTKEHLLLTAEFLRGDEDFFVEILGDVLSSSKFARHEFAEEVIPSLAVDYEQAQANPLVLGFDQLTSAAFRSKGAGLGASLFASPNSPISYDQTVKYASSVFGKDNLAVLGSGIEAQKLASLVEKSFAGVPASASGAASPNSKTQYHGGEQRIALQSAHGGPVSPRAGNGHIFLAFEGAAQGSAPGLAVLRSLLGGEASVKWSAGQSPLAQIRSQSPLTTASAFNLGFSDAGLFGIYVSAPHERLQAVAKAAINALKDIAGGKQGASEDVKRAVAKAKFEAATALESRTSSHEAISSQLLEGGKVSTLDSVYQALDKVDASAVSKAAEKALKSKPTVVAIGDLHNLPYADEVM